MFTVLGMFQGTGGFALIIQRWIREVGSIAYLITDSNGCTPQNRFGYLEQGARARAFRILQKVEAAYSGVVIAAISVYAVRGDVGSKHYYLKALVGLGLVVIWIPVIVYEVIVATKGRPVVISGNCMLVELDPKWGFLDSEIEVWWKVLVSFSGL